MYFRSLGYSLEHWERLQSDLRQLGQSNYALPAQQSPYGEV